MKIDGRMIALHILDGLISEVQLKSLQPCISIYLLGNDTSSVSYIKQKQKMLQEIGGIALIHQYETTVEQSHLEYSIKQDAQNPLVHGIIIQRPIAHAYNKESLMNCIPKTKDVDGFVLQSPYTPPIGEAILTILQEIHYSQHNSMLLIGRGETAGKPIDDTLTKNNIKHTVATSKTNIGNMMKNFDIIISAVGKENIVRPELIKRGVILLSVGMWKDADGHFHGDYEEKDIIDIAAKYTPTPGGVGPVNVACLMKNLVHASVLQYT
jgi:methylenetetrahydrofolate dehydrogenase (NADP+) / methenyltetrahydrofolate cyclohydrolase